MNMDEAELRTVAQLQEFLDATREITSMGAHGEDYRQRYEHISLALKALSLHRAGQRRPQGGADLSKARHCLEKIIELEFRT